LRRFLVLAGVAACAACNVAPDYHRPTTLAVTAFKEAVPNGAIWHAAAPADDQPRGEWWRVFGDATLDQLEDRVSSSNENLKAAVARYDQARAEASFARAEYFPFLSLGGSASRERMSQVLANPRPKTTFNDYQLQGDVSYEVDLWGRVQNSINSAGDQAEASAGDLASLQLSTHAELATDYFSLRGDDTQQAILDRTVIDYERALQLATNRLTGGAGVESDVDEAATQLQTARTQQSDNRLNRAQLEHAIAILVGVPPSGFGLAPAPLEAAPPSVGLILPGELLERRPDIAAAERRVASANAEIGVARAAYYPAFSLDGSGGVESAMIGTLFSGPATLWSLGPSLTLNLFNGGQTDADVARSRAAYEEMAADYRNTVLGAYQEVEDNLTALTQLDQENQSQTLAVTAAIRSLDQANYRFNGGLVTYLEVVTTENAALQARLQEANIVTRRMNAAVTLVKALGGSWHESASKS
jgi:outer membrane protein, multidrug efflux system